MSFAYKPRETVDSLQRASAERTRPRMAMLLVALAALLIVSCNSSLSQKPTETPTPSKTVVDTPTSTPPSLITATPTELPTATVEPTPTPSPTSTPEPSPTAAPSQEPTRITFVPGAISAEVEGEIEAYGVSRYVLRALEGQIMSVEIQSPRDDVLLSIVGGNGEPLKRYVDGLPTWNGVLPATQDYIVHAVAVGPRTGYMLRVTVEFASGQPPETEVVYFEPGAVSATRTGSVRFGHSLRYVLTAGAGQRMMVNLTSYQAPLALTVEDPNGYVYSGQATRSEAYDSSMILVLPADGDYAIALSALSGTTSFDIEFVIKGPTEPIGAPERIYFSPGEVSNGSTGSFPAGGGSRSYVLRAAAGQTMDVRVWGSGPVLFTVQSPSGIAWIGKPFGLDGYGYMATITLPEDGDYVVSLATTRADPETDYGVTFTVMYPSVQAPGSQPERLNFAAGASSALLQGSMPAGGGFKQYVLLGAAGQAMEVRTTSDSAPVGFWIASPSGVVWWSELRASEVYIHVRTVTLPESGDYVVTLTTPNAAPATLFTASFAIE